MTLAEALARFDARPAVSTHEMLGEWCGSGVPTGHGMGGLLEAYAWYGKSFVSEEAVHPLVFRTPDGAKYAIDPRLMPRARLRAVAYRGVTTAAMVYDHLPIIDCFRRVDARTMLGVMDMRGAAPFFFLLERDA